MNWLREGNPRNSFPFDTTKRAPSPIVLVGIDLGFSITLSPCSTLEKKISRLRASKGPWVGYFLSRYRLASAVKCSKKNPRMVCTRLSQSWAPFSMFDDAESLCRIYRDTCEREGIGVIGLFSFATSPKGVREVQDLSLIHI